MSGMKLGLFVVAWVLASLAIGVVVAIVVTEALALLGVVTSGQSSYSVALNLTALLVFVSVASVPLVFRKRFVDGGQEP